MTTFPKHLLEQRVAALARHRFTVIGVFEPEGLAPTFNYVDQDLDLHYALIVVGLNPRAGHGILAEARRELLAQGLTTPAQLPERLDLHDTGNMTCCLVRAPEGIAAGAVAAHGPVWQVVWPGPNGCFPWDSGMDTRMQWVQGWGEWEGRPRMHLAGAVRPENLPGLRA